MIGERSFFGKVLELIEKEAAGANPRRRAPALVSGLGGRAGKAD